MKLQPALGAALLITTALTSPAWAQTAPESAAPAEAGDPAIAQPDAADGATVDSEDVDISTPGADDSADIVVTGRFIPNTVKATAEVISVLSSADIARTGEGDIAGALQRVTGLSVVGNGFVYVRGLGDRYSLSLLNGSPLPSPEPLKRVVPLDIFPTSVIASALVQKSYSPNYPGEFGGGVINLTTVATPREPFLNLGMSLSGDTVTTAKLGYTYSGGDYDFLGYDDGTRTLRAGVRAAGAAGLDIADPSIITGLTNADTTLLQRNFDIPANFSSDIGFGTVFDGDDYQIGVIANAGYNSTWKTRNALQESTTDSNGALQEQFNTVLTENRVLVNGLLGLGAEIGDHKFRVTNIYIHDTVKQGRLAAGYGVSVQAPEPGDPAPLIKQNTSFFERQLLDVQGVGELKFGDLSIDLRGSYAKTMRDSPYERYFGYAYNAAIGDYQNRLTGGDDESATIAFSELDERLYAGAADISYKLPTARPMSITGGYAYTDTDRSSIRYFFRYRGPNGGNVNDAVAQLRPDFLLSDFTIITNGIVLDNQSSAQGASRYDAGLVIHAGYLMGEAEIADGVRITGGARYEDAEQFVTAGAFTRTLKNDYWLPALTLTWNFSEDMQLRLHGSKTIARPQFRELAPQIYQDFESDREFTGNPFLQDSELYNAEARYEWFFDRDQRLTVAGFYKRIDNPIEAVAFFPCTDCTLQTGFSNAPQATLYGGELELQKYVPLDSFGGDFFATRRLALIANYTYSKSSLKVGDEQAVSPFVGATLTPSLIDANLLFEDGSPLTGQSDHLLNLQVGLEDTERLSQITLLFTYASKRATNRGPVSDGNRLPDLIETPGIRLDVVVREEVELFKTPIELKFEARNLTGEGYRETQDFGDSVININSYDVGASFSLGATMKF